MQSWAAALVVAAAAIGAEAAEQTFSVNLRSERGLITVADPVAVTLSATAPRGWEIELPEITADSKHVRVIDAVDRRQKNEDGTLTVQRRVRLESLLPGRYQIEPLDVRFAPQKGESGTPSSEEIIQRSTEPLTIRVRSAIGLFAIGGLREIDGTVWVPWTWRQWVIAVAAIATALALGWAAYRWLGYWLESHRTSQRSLLLELDRLDEARLHRTLPDDRLILSIAEVVRRSLRLTEGPRPVYRTTEEWIAYLQQQPVAHRGLSRRAPQRVSDAVRLVLSDADAIKFAGRPATRDQARRCLHAARRVVQSFLGDVPAAERPEGAA